jgi:hypothetical protein
LPYPRQVFDVGKHDAQPYSPLAAESRTELRTMAAVMAALTILVVAMIASYSGAFAKPTLHHLAVAVTGPQQVIDAIRDQEALEVIEVADATAAREQVHQRKADAAFVITPDRDMHIYVAGGGGHSVVNAAETVGRPLLSGFYSTFSAIVPQGSGVELLRAVHYFDGNGATTPLVTLLLWGAAGCVLALLATAAQVNYRALYERFRPFVAGRDRAVLQPGQLSPAD